MIYQIPLSVILGIGLGLLIGYLSVKFFKKFHMRDTIKVLVLFAVSFLFIVLEENIKPSVYISGLFSGYDTWRHDTS